MTQSRILIVDDTRFNRMLLETLLSEQGHAVCSAADGHAALAAIAADKPDLLLLDLMMPGLDGFEVVRRIKADPAASRIPVIIITALDNDASRARLADIGVDAIITKPVDPWNLTVQVDRLLKSGGDRP